MYFVALPCCAVAVFLVLVAMIMLIHFCELKELSNSIMRLLDTYSFHNAFCLCIGCVVDN